MADDGTADYYDLLQVSASAEPETIHRVFRLLAQRYHPDNQDTGNEARFRELHEAYTVLSDPEKRAQYDIVYQQRRNRRWKLVDTGEHAENDFEAEHLVRLTVLEILYTRRRVEPGDPGAYSTDLEAMIGRPREHMEFTLWYLIQKKFVTRDDSSRVVITADGADYLEQNYKMNLQRRRLPAAKEQKS